MFYEKLCLLIFAIHDLDAKTSLDSDCISSGIMQKGNFVHFIPSSHQMFYTVLGKTVWWFGGGTDITPSYVNEEDMKHFHGTYKEVCDKHDPEFYPQVQTVGRPILCHPAPQRNSWFGWNLL